MLESAELAFLMEAHDGMSAKIVEEGGFQGIWASGLTLSAAMGVRDSNEASWTQVLECLEFMADASRLPILLDGDTGYGNFNNVRRLVRKLCQRDVAGVCLEDKLFPKTNSFIGDHHPLADVEEFCGKIKAAQDSKSDDAFVVVARVEALIAGWGMGEALKRAERYVDAGADAILIHSRRHDAGEVLEFAERWQNRCPLVIVPTKYIKTPLDSYRRAGISVAIWANHLLRASVRAMQKTCAHVQEHGTPARLERAIAPVDELFRLTGNHELQQAEKRYLRNRHSAHLRAVILAAARGRGLESLTGTLPKAMLDVKGRPLLKRLVSVLTQCGAKQVGVVRGYGKEHVLFEGAQFFDNDAYDRYGEAWSLYCARSMLRHKKGSCVICYGDILFRRALLDDLLDCQGDIVLAVSPKGATENTQTYRRQDNKRDIVKATQSYRRNYFHQWETIELTGIEEKTSITQGDGEWIGVACCSEKGKQWIVEELEAMHQSHVLQDERADLPLLFRRLMQKGKAVRVFYTPLPWLDIDDVHDLGEAHRDT
ncbi:MAG: phosphoenolpyruvate mutase [Alphaproteobacteria bacterium GM202ARS2]|nr:phosphoenolpyruvate mutase [Alphaproteobacteria bacterium GM202ARS2]